MRKRKMNKMSVIALRNSFRDLRMFGHKNDIFWMGRYYERICGMANILWYEGLITENQYDDICKIASEISILGYYRSKKERQSA